MADDTEKQPVTLTAEEQAAAIAAAAGVTDGDKHDPVPEPKAAEPEKAAPPPSDNTGDEPEFAAEQAPCPPHSFEYSFAPDQPCIKCGALPPSVEPAETGLAITHPLYDDIKAWVRRELALAMDHRKSEHSRKIENP